ncbi:MAG: AAA family ATPase [Smithellaceae bacterium]
MWVDIDFKKDDDEAKAQQKIDKFSLKPSIIVNSGKGYHLYWILQTPAKQDDIQKIEEINRKLVFHFDGDKASTEAARILRLPGTYNIKYNPPILATTEQINQNTVYNLSDFDFLPLPPSSPQPAAMVNPTSQFTKLLDGVFEGSRHTTLVSLASHYREKRLPEDETQCLLALWNCKNKPPLEEKELIDTIKYNYSHYLQNKVATGLEAGDSYSLEDCSQIIERTAMRVSDLINKQFPVRQMIIEPWLRVGEMGMIYAKRGVGKTWLSLLIGMAATRKLQIGDWKTATPTGCLYIDGEMAAEDLRDRLMDLNMSQSKEEATFKLLCADDIRCGGLEPPNLIKQNWRDAILDYLKRHQEFKLLIIDNLASLTSGLDENLKRDWDYINQWLLKLRAIGVAVIIVHHTGKGGDQRGTSSREDALDFSIMLSRNEGDQTEEGTKFTVEFKKARRIYGKNVKPFTLYLHDVENRFAWEVVDEGPTKAERIKILLAEGQLKQNQIAKIVGVKPSYVTQVKIETKEEEKLRRLELVLGNDEVQTDDSPHTEEVEVAEPVD